MSAAGQLASGVHISKISMLDPSWVWHDGTAHVILETDAASFTVRNQPNLRGSWLDIGIDNGTVLNGVFATYVS